MSTGCVPVRMFLHLQPEDPSSNTFSARSGRCHSQLGLTFGDFDGFCAIFTLQDHFQRFLGLFTLCTAIPDFLHSITLPNLRYITGPAKLGIGLSRGMLMRADPAHSWGFGRKGRSC